MPIRSIIAKPLAVITFAALFSLAVTSAQSASLIPGVTASSTGFGSNGFGSL